ncbi:unnamed protein product [Ilex paraguariensis]|uniref:Uncharacterized protein n=1 Tax=Ilex paraguariensis TaxID=185542 RepID=A0ABC8S6C4_9AQUA
MTRPSQNVIEGQHKSSRRIVEGCQRMVGKRLKYCQRIAGQVSMLEHHWRVIRRSSEDSRRSTKDGRRRPKHRHRTVGQVRTSPEGDRKVIGGCPEVNEKFMEDDRNGAEDCWSGTDLRRQRMAETTLLND